jgi:hypothetical protein
MIYVSPRSTLTSPVSVYLCSLPRSGGRKEHMVPGGGGGLFYNLPEDRIRRRDGVGFSSCNDRSSRQLQPSNFSRPLKQT